MRIAQLLPLILKALGNKRTSYYVVAQQQGGAHSEQSQARWNESHTFNWTQTHRNNKKIKMKMSTSNSGIMKKYSSVVVCFSAFWDQNDYNSIPQTRPLDTDDDVENGVFIICLSVTLTRSVSARDRKVPFSKSSFVQQAFSCGINTWDSKWIMTGIILNWSRNGI